MRFAPVAVELAADDVGRLERLDRLEQARLRVAERIRRPAVRLLHREARDDLQQMVLQDVADRARLLVELAAALDPEALRHRDLHALDEVPVPDRLEERVAEAKVEEVLHRLLAEVVIDPEDRRLGEDVEQACG